MATFLRKKNKQEPMLKPVPSAPIPLATTTVSPPLPLFARFATSTKSSNGLPVGQRIVSSPMVLSSNARKERVSTSSRSSHATATRDLDVAKRRTTQNQSPNKTLSPIQSVHVHSEQPPLTPPALNAPILNKPLPPPILSPSTPDPSGSTPTQSSIKQKRTPPTAFQSQQQPQMSLDQVENKESKQSYQTPSTQPESHLPSRPPPTINKNNSVTSPPRRNSSLSSTNPGPQILPPIANRKMHQNTSPASFGRQNLPTPAQTQTPHPFQRSTVANQDLQPDNVNTNMPMIGASSTRMGINTAAVNDIQGPPILDTVDLPPEFALFHEFSLSNPEDRSSVHSHRIPSEHVPASNVPRSSTYSSSQSVTPRPSNISLGRPSQEKLPLRREAQLPPQPPQSQSGTMGVASSHAIGNGLLPSSMKDFYPPRVLANPTSLYSNNNNTPNPAANQHKMLNRRDHSNSPPLPPGAAPPVLNQNLSTPRNELPSNIRMQLPGRPSFQDLQQQFPNNLQNSSGSSRKSAYPQGPPVAMKGKPLIFAAMAAQEDRLDQEISTATGPPPPPPPHVQSVVKKRPSQASTHHQPSAPELSPYTNGRDSVKTDLKTFSTSLHPQQPQQPQLRSLPSTPKISTRVLPPTPPTHRRSNGSRSHLKQDEPLQQIPQSPARTRKLSKARTPSDVGSVAHVHPNGSTVTLPGTPDSSHRGLTNGNTTTRTLTKSRPTTPVAAPPHKPLFAPPMPGAPLEPPIQLNENTISNAGIPLDYDPFARVEGVTLLKPSNSLKETETVENGSHGKKHHKQSSQGLSSLEEGSGEGERQSLNVVVVESEKASAVVKAVMAAPPTPNSPEELKTKKKKRQDDDSQIETKPASPPPMVDGEEDNASLAPTAAPTATEEDEEDEPEPEPILPLYTINDLLSDPQVLSSLLTYLSFYDWCVLSSLSKEIRILLVRSPALREVILERFLKTVGYSRWTWDDPDPLSLSLQDLNDYMRGVSTPTHEYARVAGMYVHSLTVHPNHRDPSLGDTVRILTASTRAYTRVILRLRAQAEKEAILAQQTRGGGTTAIKPLNNFNSPSPGRGGTSSSRVSSRAPSPTASSYSHSYNGHVPGSAVPSAMLQQQNSSQTSLTFRSPLFRLRRAPLLRVFVPSPEGDWLSDKSVLACEAECKRAGVLHLMRLGDVVWDVAVGDEGNVGRLVWDGSYLIDLDYTYTSIGDLPKYMPALAFPPSYFHRVIRTGPVVSNPIVHVDIRPWGEEIAMNLQLLQDRVRTETPQGAIHNVVRWVHRSSFVIRPPRGGPAQYSHQGGRTQVLVPRIPIPDTDNLFVDSGWYGTIVVEIEGTNEALADLQERCGPGAFPPRSRGLSNHHPQINQIQIENKKVFRILREKSRPGEIWIKAVGFKERLL